MMIGGAGFVPNTTYQYNNFIIPQLFYNGFLAPAFSLFERSFNTFHSISHIFTESRIKIRLSRFLNKCSNHMKDKIIYCFYNLISFQRYLHNFTATLQKAGFLQNKMSQLDAHLTS